MLISIDDIKCVSVQTEKKDYANEYEENSLK